jgi:hypothetical protein
MSVIAVCRTAKAGSLRSGMLLTPARKGKMYQTLPGGEKLPRSSAFDGDSV